MTVSCVQILEVRVQCVVVDVHIDQALQKKKNSKSNINMFLSQGIDTNIAIKGFRLASQLCHHYF